MIFQVSWEDIVNNIFLEILQDLSIPIFKEIIFLFGKNFKGFGSMIILERLNKLMSTELSL